MAPSFDSVSSLLCVEEDKSSIFDESVDDSGVVKEEIETTWQHRNHRRIDYQDLIFGNGDGFLFPIQSDECLGLMIEREIQHLPGNDYLTRLKFGDFDLSARSEIIDWIGKVHAYFNFGPLSAYLSVNYLDRFLSAYELPKGKSWMMQLLGIACLSLAAKMEETEVPLSLDLQIMESKFMFEAKTVQRMELLILSTLKWRMQAITPFSFIDIFLRKINGDEFPTRTSIFQSIQLILRTIKGIDFLEFRPSEIAAAIAISVIAGENQIVHIDRSILFNVQHLQKERVMKCIELLHSNLLVIGPATLPHSPIGVLDGATCLSYKTDEDDTSSHNKRRKPNIPYEEVEE